MWKEYSEEKPTEEEHQYLVKEIVSNGTMEYLTFFHTCGYSKNLSKLDAFDFHGKTSGGFYLILGRIPPFLSEAKVGDECRLFFTETIDNQ